MKLYQVTAAITRVSKDQWHTHIDCPTFYLRDDMQGIVNTEHAEGIARRMLRELAPDAVGIHISIAVSADFAPETIGA